MFIYGKAIFLLNRRRPLGIHVVHVFFNNAAVRQVPQHAYGRQALGAELSLRDFQRGVRVIARHTGSFVLSNLKRPVTNKHRALEFCYRRSVHKRVANVFARPKNP